MAGDLGGLGDRETWQVFKTCQVWDYANLSGLSNSLQYRFGFLINACQGLEAKYW